MVNARVRMIQLKTDKNLFIMRVGGGEFLVMQLKVDKIFMNYAPL